MASPVQLTATDNGVTVTAEQTIVDNYCAHIAFKIEGFPLEEGQEPSFESYEISANGKSDFSSGSSFYDGLIQGNDGKVVYADGSPIDDDAFSEKYVQEDGSLEYEITAVNSAEDGFFINKPIHVELKNLGIAEKAEHTTTLEGTWSFDWTTEGSNEVKKIALEQELGDTGIKLTDVELSPISWCVKYQISTQLQEELQAEDPENPFWADDNIPQLTGAILKDGTMLPYLYGGPGGSGFLENDPECYQIKFVLDRIIDPEEIESLLFRKTHPEGEGAATEENFYVVPVAK